MQADFFLSTSVSVKKLKLQLYVVWLDMRQNRQLINKTKIRRNVYYIHSLILPSHWANSSLNTAKKVLKNFKNAKYLFIKVVGRVFLLIILFICLYLITLNRKFHSFTYTILSILTKKVWRIGKNAINISVSYKNFL